MAITYGRPRLISSDDKRYRAYIEQFLIARNNQRAMRPPRQRDLFGGQAEAALRNWLAGRYQLAERRILEYEERRGSRASVKYRELDALILEDRTAWVFEIKASRTAASLRKAVSQLNETRAILKLLFPLVNVTVLLVDTGIPADAAAREALMNSEHPPSRPPELLSEVLAALPEMRQITSLAQHSRDGKLIDLLCFSVEDIIGLAGAENLALDWQADDQEPEPPPPPADELLYSTGDDDEDNPLAAALKKAGLR